MALPNFMIIGSTKAGTTSLWHYVHEHPEIYMSPVKEPHFFAYKAGIPNYAGPGDRERMSRLVVSERRAYERLFDGGAECPCRGEASAMYLYLPEAAKNIRSSIPDCRLIAILRNPVDRAYSAYNHHVRDGLETLSFEESVQADIQGDRDDWSPLWHYWKMGLYSKQLRRYQQFFPSSQIRVYLYDQLTSDPDGLLAELLAFLGVSTAFHVKQDRKHNVSGIPKRRWLHQLLTRSSPAKRVVKRLLPRRLVYSAVTQLKNANLSAPPSMAQQTRSDLTQRYADEIQELEQLTGFDLSGWLEVSGGRSAA